MKTYTYDEVYKNVIKYFNGDELASDVWMKKYALKESDSLSDPNPYNWKFYEKSPVEMHERMAKEFGRIEDKFRNERPEYTEETFKSISTYGKNRKRLSEEKIMEYFDKFQYIVPQGSVMASLGNDKTFSSLSNCIVIPEVYDSYGGICFADQQLVQLMKRRCGVGVDISTLRPKNTFVSNAAGTSTGAISFMERFSNTTREVAQSGRRGALMITIDVKHPDVEDFITIKQDLQKVTGANISVKLSDEFMKAVQNDEDFTLQFPIHSENPTYEKTVKAKELWDKISTAARNSAEPGLIFWDRHHYYSTSSLYPQYKNISTNPCLTGDVEVITDKGIMTMKEIFDNFNDIKGIKSLSYNEKTKESEFKTINDSMLTRRNANIIELELDNGSKIKLTPDHKVFTENRGWIEAAKLTENDILLYVEK